MKKVLLMIVLALGTIILFSAFGGGGIYPGGAPAGYTGSPADGANCTACHGGTASNVTGWITSDIPGSGYVPGATYNITVTVPGATTENKGFEVSPQKLDGTLQGTMTAGTGCKMVGSGKYMTQNAPMTANPSVWTFGWTAPTAGTGSVTFYGAFAVGLPSTFLSTLTVNETTFGIEPAHETGKLTVYPNPVIDKFTMTYTLKQTGHVEARLYDISGKVVSKLIDEDQFPGNITKTFTVDNSIKSGVYFLKVISSNSTVMMKRLVIE